MRKRVIVKLPKIPRKLRLRKWTDPRDPASKKWPFTFPHPTAVRGSWPREEKGLDWGTRLTGCTRFDSVKMCFSKSSGRMTVHWRLAFCPTEQCVNRGEGHYYPHKKHVHISSFATQDIRATDFFDDSISQKWRGKGVGEYTYKMMEKYWKEKRKVKDISLEALASADEFWRRMGFHAIWNDWSSNRITIGHPDYEGEGGPKVKFLTRNALDDYLERVRDYERGAWIDYVAPGVRPR